MSKSLRRILPSAFAAFVGWGVLSVPVLLLGADRVAVGTKVREAVERRVEGTDTFSALSPPSILFDGDHIRTGPGAFLVMVYLDDKSMLKVKENSDLEIRGTREGEGISKKVDMTAGTLKAEVSRQRKGDFVISTPTSVASVKGTTFWIISNPVTGDQLFGLEGAVELMNLISGNIVTVGAGETGLSSPDGSVAVSVTVSDDVPEDEEETGEEIKELRIRFKNPDGEERDLIINYD
ncbi:MAG: FecR domain-containing protein [Fidelibacterota bacterium]